MISRRWWVPDEDDVLRMLFADTPTDAIAAVLGRTLSSTFQRARNLGLSKDPAYLASEQSGRMRRGDHRGKLFQFKKGQVPHNKGKAFPVAANHPNCRRTQFRKGERSGVAVKLWRPIGTERVSKDGYLERKINDGLPAQRRWRAVHLLTWEAANGPLPKGHKIAFRNGNKRDFGLGNLELVSNAEMMRRNTYHRYGKEIARTIQLIGAVTRKINRRKREEQDRRSA